MRCKATALLFGIMAAARAAGEPAQRGMLWEVRGGAGRAFVAGSIHAADPSLYPLPAAMEEAFAASKVLVVEADVSDRNAAALREAALRAAKLPEGRRLSEVVPAVLWKDVQKRAKELGIDPAGLAAFEPWFAAITLDMAAVMRLGVDPARGVDRHFLEKAGDRRVVELEGAKFQFDLFHGLDAKTQELFLRYSMDEIDSVREELPKIFAAWRRGDDKALEEALFEPLRKHKEMEGLRLALFTRRNERMAARVEKLLAEGAPCFVVVGAGHLVGADGIPALLRARGFEVLRR